MKFRQSMQWVCGAGVALVVAACGGGGGDAPAPDMSTANRIEPFDPTLGKALKAAPPLPRAAGAAPKATPVRLGPLAVPALQSQQKKAGLNPGNFDYVLVGEFDTVDDYLVYRDHPAHQAFIAVFIAGRVASRAAVQSSTA